MEKNPNEVDAEHSPENARQRRPSPSQESAEPKPLAASGRNPIPDSSTLIQAHHHIIQAAQVVFALVSETIKNGQPVSDDLRSMAIRLKLQLDDIPDSAVSDADRELIVQLREAANGMESTVLLPDFTSIPPQELDSEQNGEDEADLRGEGEEGESQMPLDSFDEQTSLGETGIEEANRTTPVTINININFR